LKTYEKEGEREMKHAICWVMVLGLMAVMGCQSKKPEDVAREFMDRQITAHEGFELDTSKLDYDVIEEGSDTAKVAVSGEIAVEGEIPLVKTDGKWVVAEKGAAPQTVEQQTTGSEPAAEESPASEPAKKTATTAETTAPKESHQ
jgi:hypothetical protein